MKKNVQIVKILLKYAGWGKGEGEGREKDEREMERGILFNFIHFYF